MNSATVRNLLVRGMLAGLGAGLLALVAAYFLGEPNVDSAISFEAAHSHEHEMEIVSRSLQSTAGRQLDQIRDAVIGALGSCFAACVAAGGAKGGAGACTTGRR